jgi:hypothetical protein
VSVRVSVGDRNRPHQVENGRIGLVPQITMIAKFPYPAQAFQVRRKGTENPCVECSIHSLPTTRPGKNRLPVSGSCAANRQAGHRLERSHTPVGADLKDSAMSVSCRPSMILSMRRSRDQRRPPVSSARNRRPGNKYPRSRYCRHNLYSFP